MGTGLHAVTGAGRSWWRCAAVGVAAGLCAGGLATGATGAGDGGGGADAPAELPPAEAAVERLLGERGEPAAFERAVKEARGQGVAEQVILEARFLYHVDRRDDAALAALAPVMLERRDAFEPGQSAIFARREDWLAVVEYVQAIAALRRGERDAFKRHITEAFWLSPGQGAAFAPHIERLRMDEAMARVRVDFSTRLRRLAGGEEPELAAILGARTALVLHFWSPASSECEELAGDFAATARALEKQGIAVASVLVDDDPQVVEEARRFVAAGARAPGHWLRDRKADPLRVQLRVQSVPVLVLVATDGRVLFNGHPAEDECWNALRRVAPALARPAREELAPGG